MHQYLQDRLVKIGLALVIFGSAPLVGIIVLAKIGIWPDPDPNPIGPGLLTFATFWPGIITVLCGVVRVRRRAQMADL